LVPINGGFDIARKLIGIAAKSAINPRRSARSNAPVAVG